MKRAAVRFCEGLMLGSFAVGLSLALGLFNTATMASDRWPEPSTGAPPEMRPSIDPGALTDGWGDLVIDQDPGENDGVEYVDPYNELPPFTPEFWSCTRVRAKLACTRAFGDA